MICIQKSLPRRGRLDELEVCTPLTSETFSFGSNLKEMSSFKKREIGTTFKGIYVKQERACLPFS